MIKNKYLGERETDTHIFFWNGIFCQWHKSSFKDADTHYNCTEQYMMAKKAEFFGDEEILLDIMATRNPRDQKALGRQIQNFDATAWDGVCLDIVTQGNRLKFSQNEDLREMLISTKDKTIVEASPYDKIWGIGIHFTDDRVLDESKWNGKNLLGEAIMKVRKEILDA